MARDKREAQRRRMVAAEMEVITLTNRFNKLLDSYYNIQTLATERQAMLEKQRARMKGVLDRLYEEHCGKVNHMTNPAYAFDIAEARCKTCRGHGGRRYDEVELDEIRKAVYVWRNDGDIKESLRTDSDAPLSEFANPRGCAEDWCEACWGTGYDIETPYNFTRY